MRVGEFTVISPRNAMKDIFMESICGHITQIDDRISFSSLDINKNLAIHFYGIKIDLKDNNISWDLLTPKILGHIFLFNWENEGTLKTIEKMLDHLAGISTTPIMVIANVNGNNDLPIPEKFVEPNGFALEPTVRFTYCQLSDSKCTKRAVSGIVNILMERLP